MKLPLIRLFGEITRRDDENRVVEGYVFVNEDVGDGVKLLRSTMEAATEDYMRWGCVREMHSASAVGTALDLNWDDKGAFFRAKIVDDAAWEKCKEGVYKGFSVGVRPRIMRGKDCTKADWVENSLVDRPKDWDAVASLGRAADYDGETEFEVEEEAVNRGEFAERIKVTEKSALRNAAWFLLDSILWDIQYGSDNDKASQVRSACSEFAEYIAPIISRGEFGTDETLLRLDSSDKSDLVTRLASAEANSSTLVKRIETAEAEVTRLSLVETEHTGMVERLQAATKPVEGESTGDFIARVEGLLKAPAAQDKPLKVTVKGLVERLNAGPDETETIVLSKAQERYQEILSTDWSKESDETKRAAFLELEGLKRTLEV